MEISNIKQLNDKISQLNSRAAQVNNERNQNIGKRDTLIQQREKLLQQYKEKYGVELTPETLDSEIQKVMSEKEQEATKLENVLNAISSGDYSMANSLMGVKYEETVSRSSEINANLIVAETEIMHRNFSTDVQQSAEPQAEAQQTYTPQVEVAQSEPTQAEVAPPVAQPTVQQSQPSNFPFGGQASVHEVAQPSSTPQTGQVVPPPASAGQDTQGLGDMLMNMFGAEPTSTKANATDEVPPVAPPPQSVIKPPQSGNPLAQFSQPVNPNSNVGGLNLDSSPVAPPPQAGNPMAQFEHLFNGTAFNGN